MYSDYAMVTLAGNPQQQLVRLRAVSYETNTLRILIAEKKWEYRKIKSVTLLDFEEALPLVAAGVFPNLEVSLHVTSDKVYADVEGVTLSCSTGDVDFFEPKSVCSFLKQQYLKVQTRLQSEYAVAEQLARWGTVLVPDKTVDTQYCIFQAGGENFKLTVPAEASNTQILELVLQAVKHKTERDLRMYTA